MRRCRGSDGDRVQGVLAASASASVSASASASAPLSAAPLPSPLCAPPSWRAERRAALSVTRVTRAHVASATLWALRVAHSRADPSRRLAAFEAVAWRTQALSAVRSVVDGRTR